MRFNPRELTLPPGTVDATFRKDIARFYGGIFAMDFDVHCMEWREGAGPRRKWTYV